MSMSLFRIIFCFFSFFLLSSFEDTTKFSPISLEKNSVAGYLSLPKDRSIDNTTYLYIKYALESFRQRGVSFVLLDLDTPGGEVFSALRIVEELRKMDSEYGIPVIAFVDNWAISAGALLAYSCRFIGATDLSSMGAAEPVLISSEGKMEAASEKMVSALRVEFAKTAKLYGRDPLIAEAMVDRDVVLVVRDGKVVHLLTDSQILEGDKILNAKGKLLTLNGAQMQELGVSDFLLASGPHGALSGESLLKQEPFFSSSTIEWLVYSNWKIDFFSFLTHPFVSSFLILGLMIGLYGSIQNPTLGFSSILALCCLALVLLSTFSTQLVGLLDLLFLLVGLSLLLVDLFCFGFSFLGGLGVLLALGGLFSMILPSLEGISFSPNSVGFEVVLVEWVYRLGLFLFSLLIGLGIGTCLSRLLLKKGLFGKRLILKDTRFKEEIYEEIPKKGEIGIAFSSFRPFGKLEIDGKIYEGQSEGEFIEQGSKVEVLGSLGRFLVVREVFS